MTRRPRLFSAALALSVLAGGALAACQRYEVDPVSPAAAKVQKKVSQVAKQVAPNVLLVVDRSGSMADGPDGSPDVCLNKTGQNYLNCKWDELLTALTGDGTPSNGFVYKLDAQSRESNASDPVRLGLMTFAGVADNGTGDPFTPGLIRYAPTVNPGTGQVSAINSVLLNIQPGGGTPTAASLQVAAQAFASVSEAGRNNYIVLLTDGAPNGNASFAEGPQRCIIGSDRCTLGSTPGASGCYNSDGSPADQYTPRGCLDEANTVNTVAQLKSQGISTFVIGFGADFANSNSATYETLDRLATAGGEARASEPLFYRATSASDLKAALDAIAAIVRASCTYNLDTPPASAAAVEVVVTPPGGQAQTLTSSQYSVSGSQVLITDAALCSSITSASPSAPYVVEVDYLGQ